MESLIEAHLELTRRDDVLSISAWVSAPSPNELRWRLTSISETTGGRSQVSQSGRVNSSSAPVGVLNVTRNSRGEVVLSVYDGEVMVAQDTVKLDEEEVPVEE